MSNIYTGAMGIISNMTRMNLIANNIANAQTKGYKSDDATFRVFNETNAVSRSFKDAKGIGKYEDMVYVDDIKTNFSTGTYEASDNPLDLSVVDDASKKEKTFFVVSDDGKEYLTKNGQFTLDGDRRISTFTGELVKGTDGKPIQIPEGQKYVINKDGTVQLTDNNETIGKIKLVSIADDDLVFLQKERSSLFSVMNIQEIQNRFAPINQLVNEYDKNVTYQRLFPTNKTLLAIQQTGQVDITKDTDAQIQTSTAESSNVDLANELTSMMQTQRSIQSSQKVWQAMSDILDKESSQIGK